MDGRAAGRFQPSEISLKDVSHSGSGNWPPKSPRASRDSHSSAPSLKRASHPGLPFLVASLRASKTKISQLCIFRVTENFHIVQVAGTLWSLGWTTGIVKPALPGSQYSTGCCNVMSPTCFIHHRTAGKKSRGSTDANQSRQLIICTRNSIFLSIIFFHRMPG